MSEGSSDRLPAAGRRLVAWYRTAARDLPWRRNRDPYAVWVSETMLQQTTVAAVTERYARFLRKFPTVHDLASADETSVLTEVQGLGYYRRFRSLHRAAKIVSDEHRGVLPQSADSLEELPGVGPYMAGAICSIAFDQPTPAVDGNVVRVLARLEKRAGDLLVGRARRAVDDDVRLLMRDVSPNALTQALFDLGATICTPRDPSCLFCPVRDLCRAYADGEVDLYPESKTKKAAVDVFCAHAWIERRGRILLRRRAETEKLMPGFWEIPNVWAADEAKAIESLHAELFDLWPREWTLGDRIAKVRHTITHHRLECVAFAAEFGGRDPSPRESLTWVPLESPSDSDRPLSSISRKLMAAVERGRSAK